jgi:hypothetical protein
VVRGRGGTREGAEGVLGRDFFFLRLGDLEGVRVLEFGGDRTRGNSGSLGEGVKGRGRGGRGEAGSLVAFGERVPDDGRGSTRERGFSACREDEVPRGYPCTSSVGGSRGEGVFLIAVDSTREVFLGVLGEVFDAEVTREGKSRGSSDTCTRRETSLSVVVTRGLRVLREQLFLRLLLTTCRASEYTLDFRELPRYVEAKLTLTEVRSDGRL